MKDRISVDVQGIADSELVGDVEQAIRASFHHIVIPGAWRVFVTPSGIGGRWDLRLESTEIRHILSIAAPPERLAALITRRLRDSLARLVAATSDRVEAGERGVSARGLLRAV
jgi:hypothetical protein